MNKLLIPLLIFVFFSINSNAQKKYPDTYFQSPVDFRILLSGTFGELRGGHFHSGIDIKTEGVTGKNVHAIADGYISRIAVSGTGFGKAIYISHPNGYTSVYGHLSKFAAPIEKYVKEQQYKKEQFVVNLFPPKELFVVKKGEVIALSGNSGSSEGPHLHFEIRDSRNEFPTNPLLFGFKVKDQIRPKIIGFRLYPVDEQSKINNKNQVLEKKITGSGLNNRLSKPDTILVSGNIGFGINTYDLLNDSNNKNGVYSISLKIDTSIIYSHHLEKFSYDETKYVNSLIDYAEYIRYKKSFQRSIIDPGNKLSIYDQVADHGVYNFSDSLYHQFVYEVKDAAGNTSRLTGILKSVPYTRHDLSVDKDQKNWFKYDQDNSFKTDNLELYFKKGSFYRSFKFEYQTGKSPAGSYSVLHKIHTDEFPVNDPYTIKIKPENLPERLQNKALIAMLDKKQIMAVGGDFKEGYVVGQAGTFGDFMVVVDTVKPEITALNIHDGKNISGYNHISFQIKDELSGIRSYRGTLNNQWILMDYDPKNNRLVYQIDERMKKGKNHIKLEVMDAKENLSVYEADIAF